MEPARKPEPPLTHHRLLRPNASPPLASSPTLPITGAGGKHVKCLGAYDTRNRSSNAGAGISPLAPHQAESPPPQPYPKPTQRRTHIPSPPLTVPTTGTNHGEFPTKFPRQPPLPAPTPIGFLARKGGRKQHHESPYTTFYTKTVLMM